MRYFWEANRVVIGGIAVVASRYAAGVRGRAENVHEQFSFIVPTAVGGETIQAGKTVSMAPGRTGSLSSPSMPGEYVLGSRYEGVQVSIPARVVEATLDALTGVSRTEPLRFELAVDLRSGGGASAVRLLDFLLDEADRDASPLMSPLVQSRLVDAFVSALVIGLPHNYSHLLRATPTIDEPRYVRRAAEYLEANARRHIGVTELAAAAGIGTRALFAAFRRHRGCSPMAFLRARRFELARQRLLAASAPTVAVVAMDCGFEHLGRFSAGYRARYGESPAETLHRAQAHSRGA